MASTHRGCWFESIVANNIMGHSLQPLLTASLACGNQVAMNYGSERHLIAKRKVKHLYEVRYSNTGSRLACFTQKDIWWEVFFKGSLANTSSCSFQESPGHPLAALQVLGPQLCQGFAKPGLADNSG